MTNPTPEYCFKVTLNDPQHSFEKLNTAQQQGPITDAISSSAFLKAMEVSDLEVDTAIQTVSSGGVMKKTTTDTPATTAAKTMTAGKRKLSFKVNEKDEIDEEVFKYPFPSDANHVDVWWMDDELDQLLTEAMLLADHYTRKRKDWQNKIKKIMKLVAAGTSNKKKEEGASVEAVKGSDLDFVCDSEARGLELYIHPIFQKNRVKAIKGVVKVQEDYNVAEKKKGKVDQELRIKVLRAQSVKLTQLSRCMARTMADGDRRAVMKQDDDDDESSGTDAPVPTEIKLRISATSEAAPAGLVKELLDTAEQEAAECDSPEATKTTRRPRKKSIMRGFSPNRSQLRNCTN